MLGVCRAVGVEMQCIGHFKLLFSLLRVDGRSKVQQHALEVLALSDSLSVCLYLSVCLLICLVSLCIFCVHVHLLCGIID